MYKVFCPKCDEAITITGQRLDELKSKGATPIVCPQCTHQLTVRVKKDRQANRDKQDRQEQAWGHIIVLENIFGYKQYFPLQKGLNRIGRRNKDTETDIPIVTGDPSMDRHHCIIKVSRTKQGELLWSLSDNSSRVGTYVGGDILGSKDWYRLQEGDIFTLGATSIIFSTKPLREEETYGLPT